MHGSIGPAACSCGARISLTEGDRVLLRAVARAIFEGARGGLDAQMRRPLLPSPPPPKIKMKPAVPAQSEPGRPSLESLVFVNGFGGFTTDGREFHVSARPPAPWSNVIANERFGFIATDSGFGTTWSENSYHNRLTPWSNDPIVDPPSEVVYLRDDKSGRVLDRNAGPRAGAVKHVAKFGQGYATYSHRHRGLDVELTAFVPENDPVKILRLRIRNDSTAPRELSAFYYVDWCLSDTRSRSVAHIVTSIDTACGALFARNAFRSAFGSRVAFMDVAAQNRSMTGDRSGLHRPQRHAVRSARDGVRPSARARRRRAGSMRRRADNGHRRCRGIDRGDVPAR